MAVDLLIQVGFMSFLQALINEFRRLHGLSFFTDMSNSDITGIQGTFS